MLFYSNYDTRLQKDTAKDGMVQVCLCVFFFTSFKLDLLSCISRISPSIQQFRMWRESKLCGPSAPETQSTSESSGALSASPVSMRRPGHISGAISGPSVLGGAEHPCLINALQEMVKSRSLQNRFYRGRGQDQFGHSADSLSPGFGVRCPE